MTTALEQTNADYSLGGRRRQKRCRQCRQVFTAVRYDARFCGDTCRKRSNRTAVRDKAESLIPNVRDNLTPTDLAALDAVPVDEAGDDELYPWRER